MRKIYFIALMSIVYAINVSAQNNQRLLDQPMVIKKYTATINADVFTATTFIEIEFFNPKDKEIEGLYTFDLQPGQVITGFQLDINGKFRNGTIEERWKARNAYNTIVGKRVDPGLLQMDYADHYRLNIYPIPAGSSRKVTITLLQAMKQNVNDAEYFFPLKKNDSIIDFSTTVFVNCHVAKPVSKQGLLSSVNFEPGTNGFNAKLNLSQYKVTQSLQFSIPFAENEPVYCTKQIDDKTYFALRTYTAIPEYYSIQPKKILVYWDISSSSGKRRIEREVNFLEKYIIYNQVGEVIVVPFNIRRTDTIVFNTNKSSLNKLRNYLMEFNYDGGTRLGVLDFSAFNADVVLLFSDGVNTYGKSMPQKGNVEVHCIHSSNDFNSAHIEHMIRESGGIEINLDKLSYVQALQKTSLSRNLLMNITANKNKTIIEQQFPILLDEARIFWGVLDGDSDELTFYYGNNKAVNYKETIRIGKEENCSTSSIERLNMLLRFQRLSKAYWEDKLDFGLNEKIVTSNTSFIVLEKAEDYIKYNIEPPVDLKEECAKLKYVKTDTRFQRTLIKKQSEREMLNKVINEYNVRIKKWNAAEDLITPILNDDEVSQKVKYADALSNDNSGSANMSLSGSVRGLSASRSELSEVVVTGYGMSLKKSLTGSVSYISQNSIFPGAQTIEQVLAGKVAGLEVRGDGLMGRQSSITLRGASSLSSSNPLFVVDGMPVSGNINDIINPANIESITVLKDASSIALYGGSGANGVIFIKSKSSRRYYSYDNYSAYKLKNMSDIEYITEMKNTPQNEWMTKYAELREVHENEPGFYFDIAQLFFEKGYEDEAVFILTNAAEKTKGMISMQTGIAYTFENWKKFDKAVEIYESILTVTPDDINAYRNLAWAYYQNDQYQQSINLLYTAILKDFGNREDDVVITKSMLLNELNAIISAKKPFVNISNINSRFIKPLQVDLRIVVDDNMKNLNNVFIKEPGGYLCSGDNAVTKNGGYFTVNRSGYSWYNYGTPREYQLKNIRPGKYKIKVNYYGGYHDNNTPSFIRVTTFKNFGKPDQQINVQNIIMDNQNGEIEIAEINE